MPSSPKIYFPKASFDITVAGKVSSNLSVGQTGYQITCNASAWYTALSKEGIPTTQDASRVFVLKAEKVTNAHLMFGFTSAPSYNTSTSPFPSDAAISNVGLRCWNGTSGDSFRVLPQANTYNAKEIIAVITFSNNGAKTEIKWIVDGIEGNVLDCSSDFTAHKEIFLTVTLWYTGDHVRFIPITEVTNRSGPVVELLKKFQNAEQPPAPVPALIKSPPQNSFVERLARTLNGMKIDSSFFGLANTGKSLLFNCFIYSLLQKYVTGLRPVGAATTDGAQFSTTSERDWVSFHLDKTVWDVSKKGDFSFRDNVGFTGNRIEFMSSNQGKFKTSQFCPRGSDDESGAARTEIAKKKIDYSQHTSCIALCISAEYLINNADKEKEKIIKSIIEWSKDDFKLEDGTPIYVPIIVLITKCDLLASNPEPKDLLYQRNSEKLADTFKKCEKRFGVPQNQMIALGFLNDCDNGMNWSFDSQDPVVLTLRHAFLAIAEAGQLFRSKMEFLQNEVRTEAAEENTTGININNWRNGLLPGELGALGPDCSVSQVNVGPAPAAAVAPAVSVAAVTESLAERATLAQAFKDMMANSGCANKKDFIKTLDRDTLVQYLRCLNVANTILDVFVGDDYNGADFIDDDFVKDSLSEQTQNEYKIKKSHIKSFGQIRKELLEN